MSSTRRRRRRALAAGALLGFSLAALAAAAGCGSSGSTPNAQASSQKLQVMATVTRGDLVETAVAPLQLTKDTAGGATGVGQIRSSAATAGVTEGQSVRVYFIERPAGVAPGQNASPGTSEGYPSPGAGQGSGPANGQVFGMGNGAFANAKNATATIDSVQKNSDGSLTIHVTIAKLPSGVKLPSFAMARLSSQVLAKDVLLLPRQAISGSGSKRDRPGPGQRQDRAASRRRRQADSGAGGDHLRCERRRQRDLHAQLRWLSDLRRQPASGTQRLPAGHLSFRLPESQRGSGRGLTGTEIPVEASAVHRTPHRHD